MNEDERIPKPFSVGDLVFVRKSIRPGDFNKYRGKLLRVKSIYKGISQTGWLLVVVHKDLPPLKSIDSAWFMLYKGGTETAQEHEAKP